MWTTQKLNRLKPAAISVPFSFQKLTANTLGSARPYGLLDPSSDIGGELMGGD